MGTDGAAGLSAPSFLLFLHPLAGGGIKKKEVKYKEIEDIISLHI